MKLPSWEIENQIEYKIYQMSFGNNYLSTYLFCKYSWKGYEIQINFVSEPIKKF